MADNQGSEASQVMIASIMMPLREMTQAEIWAALSGPPTTVSQQNLLPPHEGSLGVVANYAALTKRIWLV